MEEYNWNPNIETLEIFPDNINQDFKLIYHGTSILYSEEIEANGFNFQFSPFPVNLLREIINLLGDLGLPSDFDRNNDMQFVFNSAGSIDHYLHNLSRHPISFTTCGFAALNYATGYSKGGQIVGKISKAIQCISQKISELNPDDLQRDTFLRRFDGLDQVRRKCIDIQNNPGVVYVIRPTEESLKDIREDHKVIFFDKNMSPEMIIAKVNVNADFVVANNLKDSIKKKVDKHFVSPGCIGHMLIKRALAVDDEIDRAKFNL